MPLRAAVLLTVGLVAITGCSAQPGPAQNAGSAQPTPAQNAGSAQPTPAQNASSAQPAPAQSGDCAVSAVRKDPLPPGLGGGFSNPEMPPPWMGDNNFAAILFYAQGTDPTIKPGGKLPNGGQTKILWLIRGATGPLTLHGSAPGPSGDFTQNVAGSGFYPSIVVVPRSGCWTIDATVDGRRVGSIVLPAA
jgi:hypothetical protein